MGKVGRENGGRWGDRSTGVELGGTVVIWVAAMERVVDMDYFSEKKEGLTVQQKMRKNCP